MKVTKNRVIVLAVAACILFVVLIVTTSSSLGISESGGGLVPAVAVIDNGGASTTKTTEDDQKQQQRAPVSRSPGTQRRQSKKEENGNRQQRAARDFTDPICRRNPRRITSRRTELPSTLLHFVLHLTTFAVTPEWRGVFDLTLFHRTALEQRLRELFLSSERTTQQQQHQNSSKERDGEDEIFPCAGAFGSVRKWNFNTVRELVTARPSCFADIAAALRTVKIYHSVALGRLAFDEDLHRKYIEIKQRFALSSSSSASFALSRFARAVTKAVAAQYDAAAALLQIVIDANIFPVQLRPGANASAAAAVILAAGLQMPPPSSSINGKLLLSASTASNNPVLDLMRGLKVSFPSSKSNDSNNNDNASSSAVKLKEIQALRASIIRLEQHRDALYKKAAEASASSSNKLQFCRTRVFTHPEIDSNFAFLRSHLRVSAVLRYDTHFYSFQRPMEGKYWNMYRPFVQCGSAPRTCEIPEGCRFVCNPEYLARRFYRDAEHSAILKKKLHEEVSLLRVKFQQQQYSQPESTSNSSKQQQLETATQALLRQYQRSITTHEIAGVGSNNEYDWEESLIIMYRRLGLSLGHDSNSSTPRAYFPIGPTFSIFDCTVPAFRPTRKVLHFYRRRSFRFMPYCVGNDWQRKVLPVSDVVRSGTFGRTEAERKGSKIVKFFPLSGLVPALRIADLVRVRNLTRIPPANSAIAQLSAGNNQKPQQHQQQPPAHNIHGRNFPFPPPVLTAASPQPATATATLHLQQQEVREMETEQQDTIFAHIVNGSLSSKEYETQRRSHRVRQLDILKVDGESFEFVAIPEWTVTSFARIGQVALSRMQQAPQQEAKRSRELSDNQEEEKEQPHLPDAEDVIGDDNDHDDDFSEATRDAAVFDEIDALSAAAPVSLLHSDADSLGYRIDQFQYELHRRGWLHVKAASAEGLLATYLLQLQLMSHGFIVFASERNHFGTCCYEVAMVHGRYFVLSEVEELLS